MENIGLIYKKLFYKNRSLMGQGNKEALNILSKALPLKIHFFKSGTKCFDWTIPQEWILKKGLLKDSQGRIIIDAGKNILNIVNYSVSFRGKIKKEELIKHLHYNEKLPEATPYRTSYYAKNWGFCLSYNQFKNLNDSEYFVDIETEFKDGNLLIGEANIKGRSDRQIILSSYICHPLQANDGLSGAILFLYLYNFLKKKNLQHTYRFFFLPETIGSLALLSHNIIRPKEIEYAFVSTCVGLGNVIDYKKTFQGNHSIDNIIIDILGKTQKIPIKIRDYWPQGSDERQFSSPKIRIPTGSITRIRYQEYPEYHTSFDDLNLVSLKLIQETARIYFHAIMEYERYPKYAVANKGGEPFLSRYGLYRTLSVPGHSNEEIIRGWILFLSDGGYNVKDMALKSGFSENEIKRQVDKLIKFKIIKEI